MICSAVNNDRTQSSVLVVVIEKDNLERMKTGDPVTLEAGSLGGQIMPRIRYPANCSVLIAYEEDDVELYKIARGPDGRDLLRYLERGRKFDPMTDGPHNVLLIPKSGPETTP